MYEACPARKPVISTYPPDSTSNWKDTPGFRICDAEFADSIIEWHIIRLGSSTPHDEHPFTVPPYAPFIAAGFYFISGNFIKEGI